MDYQKKYKEMFSEIKSGTKINIKSYQRRSSLRMKIAIAVSIFLIIGSSSMVYAFDLFGIKEWIAKAPTIDSPADDKEPLEEKLMVKGVEVPPTEEPKSTPISEKAKATDTSKKLEPTAVPKTPEPTAAPKTPEPTVAPKTPEPKEDPKPLEGVAATVRLQAITYVDFHNNTRETDDPWYNLVVSNVTQTTFDFTIYKISPDPDKEVSELVFRTHTAVFTGSGDTARYDGEKYTLNFSFPNDHGAAPDVTVIRISGFAMVEGREFLNSGVPGYEFS